MDWHSQSGKGETTSLDTFFVDSQLIRVTCPQLTPGLLPSVSGCVLAHKANYWGTTSRLTILVYSVGPIKEKTTEMDWK